ncbi:MAG: DUF58 domain-containing protein, partial [Actinomycetota bacterium]|nr:DUF58 domain-containing protein [Actinomycetota bacterium]
MTAPPAELPRRPSFGLLAVVLRFVLPAGGTLSPLALLPLGVAAVLAGLGLLTGGKWLYLLAGAAVGGLLAAFVVRPSVAGLEVAFPAPVRAQVGDAVDTALRVTNTGRRASTAAQLTHSPPGFDPVTVFVPPLRPGSSATTHVRRHTVARGHSIGQQPVVRSSAPFGLVRVTRELPAEQVFAAHPAIVPVALPPPATKPDAEDSSVATRAGVELYGVREWQRGDAARDVAWRHTARHGRLIVLERGTAPATRLAIVVSGPAGQPDWEALVAVDASTALDVAREGRQVALGADEPNSTPLLGGSAVALLDWCAALRDPMVPRPE